MCFFGSRGGYQQQQETKTQQATVTRKANQQTSPVPAESSASGESEVASVEQKRKGRKILRIPLLSGSSGVQV